jgi:hypothetical protein
MQLFYRIIPVFLAAFTTLIALTPLAAQSTNQNFPTPVTSTEINGTIRARDVGDSRLTSYFYQLDGDQGDLFINIAARNFSGDIDVFTLSGLRPLTKIVVYADLSETETGRVIYLRKPEKMILRVQGRTPGDDSATFRIKFAGSFVASTLAEPAAEPALPSLTAKNESGIRVNSVGTIVEIIPKATPTPPPVETAAQIDDERSGVEEPAKDKSEIAGDEKSEEKPADSAAEAPERKVGVVVTDNLPGTTEPKPAVPVRRGIRRRRTPPARTVVKTPPVTARRGRTPPKTAAPKEPDPLEKINLVILFKDGTTIERPMSEVLRFTVDKGVLTVISKDGSIGRYSILDVEKLTVQ